MLAHQGYIVLYIIRFHGSCPCEYPFQAHDVEEEVLPSGPNNQHIHVSLSRVSEDGDLIVLDEQPKDVTFRCGRKRPLPATGQKHWPEGPKGPHHS